MKLLRRISTAVLLCLVFAAPAAADELSLSSTTIYPDESISFTLQVEHNKTKLDLTSESSCKLESNIHALETWSFSPGARTGTIASGYALGTYTLCEYYAKGAEQNPPAKIVKTFEVIARPVLPAPTPPVVAPASPAPVVAPISSPPTTTLPPLAPVLKPLTKAQKLHAALAKCKHQKNKRKRVKCERAARRTNHR